jgi:hypothetical protein
MGRYVHDALGEVPWLLRDLPDTVQGEGRLSHARSKHQDAHAVRLRRVTHVRPRRRTLPQRQTQNLIENLIQNLIDNSV